MAKAGSNLYFANSDYNFVKDLMENIPMYRDHILVNSQQCIEKYFKVLLLRELGEVNETHSLTYMLKRLGKVYPDLNKYSRTIRTLRDCYYTRRYEGNEYFIFQDEHFNKVMAESISLMRWLHYECNKPIENKIGIKSF